MSAEKASQEARRTVQGSIRQGVVPKPKSFSRRRKWTSLLRSPAGKGWQMAHVFLSP